MTAGRGWRGPFLTILSAVLAVELAMVALDMGPETLLVAAVVSSAAATVWCVRSLNLSAVVTKPETRATAVAIQPGADRRVRDLRSQILFGRSPTRDTSRLHVALVELVDDQLRHQHGIDRNSRPQDAATVLGPELSRFVEGPPGATSLSERDRIDRIVTLIEQL